MNKNVNKGMPLSKLYRFTGLFLSIIFGIVGLIFLVIPNKVLIFFNDISPVLGFRESPVEGVGFYSILAVAYMYVVTLLAYKMFKEPQNIAFASILIKAKFASSIVSFIIFLVHYQFLIFLMNGIVDGFIALGLLFLARKVKRSNV